jgi:hypothetical protein
MTVLRNRALWVYVAAIVFVFAGLLLLASRSVFSLPLLACGILSMFVTAFSKRRTQTQEGT